MVHLMAIGKNTRPEPRTACDDRPRSGLLAPVPILFLKFVVMRLLVPTICSILALGLPVIVVALLGHLPGPALGSNLVWMAIYGIVPTAMFLTLPIGVGLGVAWGYAQLSADGMLAIAQAMRVSITTFAVPAVLLAMPIVMATYAISCWIAPNSVARIQDVLFSIRNNLNTDLFYPQTIYTLDNNRYTLYFDRKLDDKWIGGVFFQEERNPDEQRTIIARAARVEARGGERYLTFLDGTAQTSRQQGQTADTVAFAEFVQPFGANGGAMELQRKWRALSEMGTIEFWNTRRAAFTNQAKGRAWLSEGMKRFVVPILGLIHPLAGLAFVLMWSRQGDRRQRDPLWYGMPIVILHLFILFSCEGIVYYGAWLCWLTLLLIISELLLALLVIYHRQTTVPASS